MITDYRLSAEFSLTVKVFQKSLNVVGRSSEQQNITFLIRRTSTVGSGATLWSADKKETQTVELTAIDGR